MIRRLADERRDVVWGKSATLGEKEVSTTTLIQLFEHGLMLIDGINITTQGREHPSRSTCNIIEGGRLFGCGIPVEREKII